MKKAIIIVLSLLTVAHSFAIRDTRNRPLKDFSAIVVQDCFEVHYRQSDEYRVYIDTLDGEILPKTVTTVINDTLFITYSGDRLERVRMFVSSPRISYVNVSGMSAFVAENDMEAQNMGLYVSGTGSLKIRSLKTSFAYINKSGTGKFRMFGDLVCDSVIVEEEGAGSVTLNDIVSTIASVSVSGTCGCNIKGNVTVGKFIATMNGAGAVVIDGNIKAEQNVWLEMIGAGAVKANGKLDASLLNVRMKGVGNVTASNIKVDRADVVLKGVGTVVLAGNAKMLNKDVTGMGRVKTDDLVIEESK